MTVDKIPALSGSLAMTTSAFFPLAPAARITPAGELRYEAPEGIVAGGFTDVEDKALRAAFGRGTAAALLYLGASLAGRELAPEMRFASGFAHEMIAGALHRTGSDTALTLPEPLSSEEAQRWLARLPPMPGAEYLSEKRLCQWWDALGGALAAALASNGTSLAQWLPAQSGGWARLGRVHMHLAENKTSETRPFAFLATYTTRLGAGGKPQHVALARALREFAGAGQKSALLTLLRPLNDAALKLPWLQALVDSGAVYQPTAFSAEAAHRFLTSIPVLEGSGLFCRVPDWWNAAKRPRVQVQVNLGGAKPAGLGAQAIVDFSAGLALGDEKLTSREWKAILAHEGSFIQLRGKWVEVDKEKLASLLAGWQAAGQNGVSLGEGLRMMAGFSRPEMRGASGLDAPQSEAEEADWSRVIAGPWLRETLAALRAPEYMQGAGVLVAPGVKANLRPYQITGVGWLGFLDGLQLGACLADDMGLGKTLQVLALLERLRASPAGKPRGPHLLIAPASLLTNWQAEATHFTPGLKLYIAHASAVPAAELAKPDRSRLKSVDLVATTYGTAARLAWIKKTDWDLLILDEAQAIKNPGAMQTRAVKALSSRSRVALTGTPVENRLGDLWSLFDFLNPGLLGGTAEFKRAAKAMAGAESGYAPLRMLVAPYILRRLKTDPGVISDLPPKTEMETHCLLSKKQAALYGRLVEELARALKSAEKGIARRGLVLATLLRLKQICNHPSQWQGDSGFAPEESGKFIRLAELAAEIASRQEKALIFTQFREMTLPLAGHLARVMGRPGLTLDGATKIKDRGALVERFQGDDRLGFMVLSVKAGGTGLNLTAARHVIHFDRWWNPAVENQATDRAFRIGQTHPVLVHKLVCRGTVEEKIAGMIRAKQALADQVIGGGGGEALLTEMGDAELLRTVALDLDSATAA
jgi:non-specific serine/threonine protein kinase